MICTDTKCISFVSENAQTYKTRVVEVQGKQTTSVVCYKCQESINRFTLDDCKMVLEDDFY